MKHSLSSLTVLAASVDLPEQADAPEWVHLLPKGQITTFDGRGPYHVKDMDAVIAASMANPRGIPVDENHSTQLAAPQGFEAPARGWIKEMEARDDGIWGRVEWTAKGRDLVASKEYRGISPVMTLHADARTLALIPCVSLVNKPNLRGLTALHQETSMNFMAKLAAMLGLPETATEDDIAAAIGAMKDKKADAGMTAMQSAMTEIGAVLGVDGANATAVVAAVKIKAGEATTLTALQAEVTRLTTDTKRAASEAYVDGEIAKKRAGLNAGIRDVYVTLHMEQPDVAKKQIEAMPMLGDAGVGAQPKQDADGKLTALNAEQSRAADLLGIPRETYLTTLNAERASKLEIV